MQRKLFGLGVGSLGGIFGLNYIFKGETDNLSSQLISSKDEDIFEFNEELPETLTPEKLKQKQQEQEELRKAREAFKKAREKEAWLKRLAEWVAKEDAIEYKGVKTSNLRSFLIKLIKVKDGSLDRLSRVSLDSIVSNLSSRTYPYSAPNGAIHWDALKEAVDKHVEELASKKST